MVRFAGDLLTAGQDRFDVAELDRGHAAVRSPNHAVDDLADQLAVLVHQRIAFGLADLLDDHLFGGLGSDATDLIVTQRLTLEERADLPILAVERDNNIGILSVLSLGSGLQRRFNRREHDLLIDIFLAV